jgi:hypothetical protein
MGLARHVELRVEREMCTEFWWESLKGRDHLEDLGICILGKYGLGMWIGFIWLRIGTSGGLL